MRHLITLFFAASCLTVVGQLPGYVPTDGLVAWYPFNGNANDASGNGLDGTMSNVTFTAGATGDGSEAAHFNGDAQILIPHNSLWNANTYTLTALYRWQENPAAILGESRLISKRPPSGWGSSFEHSPYGVVSWTIGGNGAADIETTIPQNTWVDVTWVFTPTLVKFYLEGQLVNSVPSPGEMNFNSLPVSIGMRGNGWHELIGDIDHLGYWSRALTETEVSDLYLMAVTPYEGCTDASACNFSDEVEVDNGSCDYSCCPGPGCCLDGLHWDWQLNGCVITNPADINVDGCVQLNDLLDLLSAYGDCVGDDEDGLWQCGDPIEYQGYDYETVQIGEQCWFAENLRALNYRSGHPIPSNLSNSEWIGTIEGAVSTYGEGDIPCDDSSQSVSACDESVALDEFGRLYNYYAVVDSRQLCPQNWRVGNTTDFSELIEFLGGTELAGELMRASSGWNVCVGCSGSGNNESGFNGKPGGGRSEHTGHFGYAGLSGLWWAGSIDNSSSDAFYHGMDGNSGTGIFGFAGNPNGGISIRCIQIAE